MDVTYEILIKGSNLTLRDMPLAISSVAVIYCPIGPLIFDTGHYGARRQLLRTLSQQGLGPSDVKGVFLSHLHFDHCQNIDLFPDARFFVGGKEWAYSQDPHKDDVAIPGWIREYLPRRKVTYLEGEGELCKGVRFFPAPGHTPGSTALVLDTADEGSVVVAGDALKYPRELLAGRSDLTYGDPAHAAESIKKIAKMADRIVPGHFQKLVKQDGQFVWSELGELPVLIR